MYRFSTDNPLFNSILLLPAFNNKAKSCGSSDATWRDKDMVKQTPASFGGMPVSVCVATPKKNPIPIPIPPPNHLQVVVKTSQVTSLHVKKSPTDHWLICLKFANLRLCGCSHEPFAPRYPAEDQTPHRFLRQTCKEGSSECCFPRCCEYIGRKETSCFLVCIYIYVYKYRKYMYIIYTSVILCAVVPTCWTLIRISICQYKFMLNPAFQQPHYATLPL